MVKSTKMGSCLILMVERSMLEVPCRFQRLYVSLAAMKNAFKERCRFVVGVDACFLKGMYKGQLMIAVGRDANNNMYPIAMAVVEVKSKDSCLEALVTCYRSWSNSTWLDFYFRSTRGKLRINCYSYKF
jgi:hypothetical protein